MKLWRDYQYVIKWKLKSLGGGGGGGGGGIRNQNGEA